MQALLTEDVEAVQKLRVLVRVQADCTVELFFHLFQSIFNSSELRSCGRELGSHCLERGEGKARTGSTPATDIKRLHHTPWCALSRDYCLVSALATLQML